MEEQIISKEIMCRSPSFSRAEKEVEVTILTLYQCYDKLKMVLSIRVTYLPAKAGSQKFV